MKKLLLLLLFPFALHAQRYIIFPEEYDNKVVNPKDHGLYSVVTGKLVPGAPYWIVTGSGCLHHSAYVDSAKALWVQGDNTSNISGLGLKGSTIGMTKTGIPNVRQAIAYANAGDPGGLGYGVASLTYDGVIILTGNTQSGFRGDGSEGNQSEAGPFVVNSLNKKVVQIAVGLFVYARTWDGQVYSWGGTRQPTPAPYMLGQGVNKPNTTTPTLMPFPEPIVDIQGGSNILLAKGQTGRIYGCAMNARYLGLGPNAQPSTKPTDITAALGLLSIPIQLAVGPQASYALLSNGDAYAWGDNTQAAIGNGQEATFSNFVAPWGGGALWVDKPVKINPAGVVFVKLFTAIGDAFYVYAEDTNGNLWVWGRNKGFVLWNGQGGDPNTQSSQPNKWDVLAPMKITGFGDVSGVTTTPPPVTPVCPTCPTCPPVVVCPPPVVCPACPPISAPRTVVEFGWKFVNGAWVPYFTYSDGTSQ